jgi:DNA-binding transcriptional regulator YiaG
MTYGQRVRAIREADEMTQREFAIWLGCHPQTVSDVERGLHRFNRDRELALIRLTGVARDYFDEPAHASAAK